MASVENNWYIPACSFFKTLFVTFKKGVTYGYSYKTEDASCLANLPNQQILCPY